MSSFDNNSGWKYDFKFNDPNTWLPTFGKWCGKGWSGGQRTGNTELSDVQKSESVTQINNRDSTVDIWCRTHDFAINATYGSPRRQLETLTADLALYSKTAPSNTVRLSAGEFAYAALANSLFRLKIIFSDMPSACQESAVNAAKNAYQSTFNKRPSASSAAGMAKFQPPKKASIAMLPLAPARSSWRYPGAVRPWGRIQPVAQLGSGRWGVESGRGQAAAAPPLVVMRSQRPTSAPVAAASPSSVGAWQPMRYPLGQLGSGAWNIDLGRGRAGVALPGSPVRAARFSAGSFSQYFQRWREGPTRCAIARSRSL